LQESIARELPAEASTTNPVDLIASGGPAEFQHAISLLLHSGEVDSVMAIYVPTTEQGAAAVAAALRACQAEYDGQVTFLSVFMQAAGAGMALSGEGAARSVPTYTFPEAAAHALSRSADHGEWRLRDPGL
jgi:acyl-CoA synthetase (NDP forming)